MRIAGLMRSVLERSGQQGRISRMRKWVLHWVLPLLLLMSQQGALLHGLTHDIRHLGTGNAGVTQVHKEQAADKLCEVCLAFAHISAMSRTEAWVFSGAPTIAALAAAAAPSSRDASPLAPRSRGPPSDFL